MPIKSFKQVGDILFADTLGHKTSLVLIVNQEITETFMYGRYRLSRKYQALHAMATQSRLRSPRVLSPGLR
jgi:hypothetical protein